MSKMQDEIAGFTGQAADLGSQGKPNKPILGKASTNFPSASFYTLLPFTFGLDSDLPAMPLVYPSHLPGFVR